LEVLFEEAIKIFLLSISNKFM
ncbi:TetR family transcriptional regulator, partial [Bacillus cereus]